MNGHHVSLDVGMMRKTKEKGKPMITLSSLFVLNRVLHARD
jgi:hypothetical protein